MTNLGEVAHPVSVVDGPRRGDGIGDLAQLGLKRLGSGQAEEIMNACASQKSMASGRA